MQSKKKFVAFVVDCNNSKAAEVYSSKYPGKQRHTTEESCAIEKKAHMKKLKNSTTVDVNVVAEVEKAS